MGMSDARRWGQDAAGATRHAAGSATAGARRVAAGTKRGTATAGWLIRRVTGASGAARTGMATLMELTAAGSFADAFVAVSLVGTIFFSTSVAEARGRVVLFLIVTMAPFAVLAPFIGPALDRMQQGRRYLLAGTLIARGLLCWGMSAAINNPLNLLPAAFAVLVLQKCYGVIRASVAPRLLPAEMTLVTANARSALMALIASSVAAVVAAGVSLAAGPGWVLRTGTIIYLVAVVLALRLPEHVDVPVTPAAAAPPAAASGDAGSPTRPQRVKALRTLGSVGPVVAEAMRGNAVLRAYNGYMFFFLAFLLRTEHFGTSPDVALGAVLAPAAAGGIVAMVIGSAVGSRAPQVLLFSMLLIATVVTAVCAWFFSFAAAIVVALVAALGTGLAKLALDSIVQREISEDVRSSAFAVSETLHQLSWVVGGLLGLLVSMLDNGQAGLGITAGCLALALGYLVTHRRQRVRLAGEARAAGHPADTHS